MKTWIFFDEFVSVADILELSLALKANAQERRLRQCELEHVAWLEALLQITE